MNKTSRYFRIGNICHQLRNLNDTGIKLSRYPCPCNVGKRLGYSWCILYSIFTLHLTNPFRTTYLTSFHHRWLSVKNQLPYLLSINDFLFFIYYVTVYDIIRKMSTVFFCYSAPSSGTTNLFLLLGSCKPDVKMLWNKTSKCCRSLNR